MADKKATPGLYYDHRTKIMLCRDHPFDLLTLVHSTVESQDTDHDSDET